jgi:nitrite reductase/ring-hydroxylating ferredoxin subunit
MGVSYIAVARAGELSPGAMKEVDLGGRAVLVTMIEGCYFAFTKECPHEGADLSAGGQLLAGAKIRCNNHSYCFDLRSGACLVPQGGAPLTVLPVEERGDEVCIKLEW